MPLDDADFTDPMLLVGAVVPGDEDSERAMAEAVVDEYVRLGFSRRDLLQLFREPHFRMTNAYFCRHGEQAVQALIDSVLAAWGAPPGAERVFVPEPSPADADAEAQAYAEASLEDKDENDEPPLVSIRARR